MSVDWRRDDEMDFSSPSGRAYIDWAGERIEVSRSEHADLLAKAVKSINREQQLQWVNACGADRWAWILSTGWAETLVKASRLINADRDTLRCFWELKMDEEPGMKPERFLTWIKRTQSMAQANAQNQYEKWFQKILGEMQDRIAAKPTGYGAWS